MGQITLKNGRGIGTGNPVFIIAEAGVNHNGDIDLAKQLIDVAKDSGADAIKFQTFKAENLNTKKAPKATYHIETTGNEQSWFDLLKTQELSRKDHEVLIDYCNKKGITFLSTPYDEESFDLLVELNLPIVKVASTDANNTPFLSYMAKAKIPLILSTGMCSFEEVQRSVAAIRKSGGEDFALLQCTSNYPAPVEDTHLRVMDLYERDFGVPVGYSDHTKSSILPVAATAAGATIFEKHFTIDKNLPGPDHRSSLEPKELFEMVKSIRETETLLGLEKKAPAPSELENRDKLRKSIVTKGHLSKGDVLTREMLCFKRPGTGLMPWELDSIIGKKVIKDISADELIQRKDLS